MPDLGKWAARRTVRYAALGLLGLLGLVGVVLVVWLVPRALYGYVPDAKDRAAAEASTRTGLIAGLAGLGALGSLAITARTYRLTEQAQLNERYVKAIEQFGSDKLNVRLGGIYAMERMLAEFRRGSELGPLIEVLSVFVRESSTSAGPTTDVVAAVTVLGRAPKRPGLSRGDLTGARIAGISLSLTDLSGAALNGADLSGAQLYEADLSGARLTGADLSGARLDGADLSGARLDGANLSGARLGEANLTGASLFQASLFDASLRKVNLADALLYGADLTSAQLDGANLAGAQLGGADLTLARGLTQEQLDAAHGDPTTRLPDRLHRPTAWKAEEDSPAASS